MKNREQFKMDELTQRFGISDATIKSSNLNENQLTSIFNDYENKRCNLDQIRRDFINSYFLDSIPGVHSVSSRVKSSYHLLEKIIRKRNNNYQKYSNLDETNYMKFITDSIGVRILIVYKSDWIKVHQFILHQFENNPEKYIKSDEYIVKYDSDENHNYLSEKPQVYARLGDSTIDYDKHNDTLDVDKDGYYRSIHYILKYKGSYLEIQVRSVFEEGWGEVDHNILYPLYKNDTKLVTYSMLLNRLTGLADEMAAYFKENCIADGNSHPTYSGFDVPRIPRDTLGDAKAEDNKTVSYNQSGTSGLEISAIQATQKNNLNAVVDAVLNE